MAGRCGWPGRWRSERSPDGGHGDVRGDARGDAAGGMRVESTGPGAGTVPQHHGAAVLRSRRHVDDGGGRERDHARARVRYQARIRRERILMPTGRFGWLPPLPSVKDHSPRRARRLLAGTRFFAPEPLPSLVDLRGGGSPIGDQGDLGSCVANAVTSVAEFMQRRAHGRHVDGSRLYLYQKARMLDGVTHGDTGTYLRSGFGALAMFGVPPESLWPYDVRRFDDLPPQDVEDAAERYQAVEYLRLDLAGEDAVLNIRRAIASSLPVAFGFSVYSSFRSSGIIQFPSTDDRLEGGHAVYAVGYDDQLVIHGATDDLTTTGAVLFVNSWGTSWGWENGYGWLPYRYFTDRQAAGRR